MPPDEYHSNVANSVYTNSVARISLLLPAYAAELLNVTAPAAWTEIAEKLRILYDTTHKYHPEYEGYEIGTLTRRLSRCEPYPQPVQMCRVNSNWKPIYAHWPLCAGLCMRENCTLGKRVHPLPVVMLTDWTQVCFSTIRQSQNICVLYYTTSYNSNNLPTTSLSPTHPYTCRAWRLSWCHAMPMNPFFP